MTAHRRAPQFPLVTGQLNIVERGHDDLALLVGHRHLHLNDGESPRRMLDPIDHLAVDEGHITFEGRSAEFRFRVPDQAVMAGPHGEVIGVPRRHGRAIAIGLVHADLAGPAVVDVTARRADINAVAQARVDHRALLIEAEAFDPAHVLVDPRICDALGRRPVEAAPNIEDEGAVFGREAGDGMRADHPTGQPVSHLNLLPVRRLPCAIGHEPVAADLADRVEFGRRPSFGRTGCGGVDATLFRFLGEIANDGWAGFCDQVAALVAVNRVAPLEQGGAGELGFGNLVTGENPFLEELIAGADMRAVPPPFLAAEDHVLPRDVADTRLIVAVAIVERNRHRLRGDDVAELRLAGEALVPVQRIDIVHRHDPAADVGLVAGLPQLAAAYLLAKPVFDVAEVE